MKKTKKKAAALGLAILMFGIGAYLGGRKLVAVKSQSPMPSLTASQVPKAEPYPYEVKRNETVYDLLKERGLAGPEIHHIVGIAKPFANLNKLKAGVKYQLFRSPEPSEELFGITFRFSPEEFLEIKKTFNQWSVRRIHETVEIKLVTYAGAVTSSLWESAETAGMDPNLISELAEIFAWQVDFAREVREGDRWRLSVEQRLVLGEPIGWGKILAAEYENAGEKHTAVLFRQADKDMGYFAPNGSSLRRMFLKTPMRFGRLSSRFQRARFHPILKVRRPHLGVDYAAPIGTPIRSVGDGVVSFAGPRGDGGLTLKIRHNSVYETAYKHLSAIKVRSGARVHQGQIIGAVGNSGLSTAPHLHFEFYQSGRFVDPLGKKFPSADPVPKTLMANFLTALEPALQTLPPWPVGVALSDEQAQSRAPSSM